MDSPSPPSFPFFLHAAEKKLRVLVIDDQPTVRAGLVSLIKARFPVPLEVHTADSLASALHQSALTLPQIATLDVDLAGADGLALMPQLPPDCRVLVLTSHDDPATRTRAMRLGACGFLQKSAPASVLVDCLSGLISTEMQGEHPPGDSGVFSAANGCGPI